MKKKILIIVVVLIFLLTSAYLYLKYIYGWMEFRKNTDTPGAYLSHVTIGDKGYAKDSIDIAKGLRTLLLNREGFFYNQAYSSDTGLLIDSILYSPDFSKLAVFVITKTAGSKQVLPDTKHDWYYDATCYLGVRQRDTIALSWIGPVFTNSINKESISNDIRAACFRTFATKDTTDEYAYNINDVRFWDSRIWRKIEEEKIKRREFEEEKKKHPENVYEPKH